MDTVIIKIYGPKKFKILRSDLFVPEITSRKYEDLTPTERTSTFHYLRHFILHPKPSDEYVPRVEVFESLTEDRQNIFYVLKIEFSVPKMLYWNSLQEVSYTEMNRVFSTLQSALKSVSIEIELDVIAKATVTAIHACKNVPLPKAMNMREIINDLGKMDLGKAYDISDKQYKKGARVLNIHSGTIDWSIYDKVSDCLRPKNKRTDKGHIDQERVIIEQYHLENREVFRYEYRIKKNQTVRREVNAILGRPYTIPVIFSDLFTPNLMKSLVLNSWRNIIQRPENQLSLFSGTDTLGLFLHILSEAKRLNTSGHSLNNALISYGLAVAIQGHGAKEVRGAIFDIWDTDHPERLKSKMELASALTMGLPYSAHISLIDKALEKYELITLASLNKGI
jgi:hypothetical protein